MSWKPKLIICLSLSFLPLAFTQALASSSASCTMNGNWQHKASGASQSCLSYVCCSNGQKTGWVAGTTKGAEDWCKSWRAAAVPDSSCGEQAHEVFSRMTLIEMARLTNQAQEGDDEDENQPPPPEIQCRYDRECDGE